MTDQIQKKKQPERRGRKPDRRRELFLRIAADIDSGKLSGKLPGVMKLADRYHTCHGTVQNAIRLLADAGYIDVLPRSGCYVRKRLEVAYDMMKEGRNKVADVYAKVGFRNQSHFSAAFKKQYGIAPTAVSTVV